MSAVESCNHTDDFCVLLSEMRPLRAHSEGGC